MKSARLLCVIAVFAVFFPLFATAKDRDEGSFQLTVPVQLGATQLQPGEYKAEWTPSGSHVNVSILQHDKVLATAAGQVIELKHPSPYDDVVLKPMKHGQATTIDEIDFENRTEALRIEPMLKGK